ncbi:MAG TPA: hypothetical protein VII22_04805 [Streptosporangiaceae bacterium]
MNGSDHATAAPAGDTARPSLDDVRHEFPTWHCWQGIAGMLYASWRGASPPVLVRGEDPADLRDSIRRWIANN